MKLLVFSFLMFIGAVISYRTKTRKTVSDTVLVALTGMAFLIVCVTAVWRQ